MFIVQTSNTLFSLYFHFVFTFWSLAKRQLRTHFVPHYFHLFSLYFHFLECCPNNTSSTILFPFYLHLVHFIFTFCFTLFSPFFALKSQIKYYSCWPRALAKEHAPSGEMRSGVQRLWSNDEGRRVE